MGNSRAILAVTLSSSRETDVFGCCIGTVLRGGDVLALIGDLGAGKTTLVRGIVGGLGGSVASVMSPTFMLVHQYQGRLPFFHLDLYRLTRLTEVESIGLSECITDETVTAIEWADRFPDVLPLDRLDIQLMHRTRTTRTVRLEARGRESRALLIRIRRAYAKTVRSARSSRHQNQIKRKVVKR